MRKTSANRSNKQSGKISPKLIIAGVIVVVIIVIAIASGVLKFEGSISRNNNQPSSGQSSEVSTPKNKTYTNIGSGISIDYPENWSVKENPGENVIVAFGSPKEGSNDKFVDNVNLTITDISSKPNLTLEQLTDMWLKQTGSAPSFEMVSSKSISIGAEAAKQLIFSYNDKGMAIKGFVAITMKNNNAYIVTYSAETGSYDNFADTANAITSSLKIN